MLGATCYASEALALTLQTRDTLIEMPGDADALGVDAVGGKGSRRASCSTARRTRRAG